MEPIRTESFGPFTAQLFYDEDGWSNDPREWSNVATIVLPEYGVSALGMEDREHQTDDGTWKVEQLLPGDEGYEEALRESLDAVLLVPLYYEDMGGHGSRVYELVGEDRWDDANAYAYTTKDSPLGVAPDDVMDVLRSEVKVLTSWLQGEVYGYTVTNAVGEVIDSCWGYVGEADHAWDEAVDAAKHALELHNKAPLSRVVTLGELEGQLPTVSYEGVTYDIVTNDGTTVELVRHDGRTPEELA